MRFHVVDFVFCLVPCRSEHELLCETQQGTLVTKCCFLRVPAL